jgi:DUF4097 and DUF4098 domain-containing protein YvlB
VSPKRIPLIICLAALFGLSALSAPAGSSVRHTERSDQVVESAGIRTIEVGNPRGDVEIGPSPDGRIHVTALKICRGRDDAEAKRLAAQLSVTAGVQGDRYVIKVTYPRRVDIKVNFWDLFSGHADSDDFGQSHEVKILLQAPTALALELSTVSGDLASHGFNGSQRLRSTSGDCTVDATGGTLDVETVSGDARVRGLGRAQVRTTSGDILSTIAGPLEARAVSGDIDVQGVSDSLVLTSTSGDISVEHAPKSVSASTSSGTIEIVSASGSVAVRSTSGDVSVAIGGQLSGASVSSTSGSVELGLLPGLDASLELTTASGEIECDVPVVLLGHGRQSMNAKYGRGGAPVKAHTVSGDLHVTSGGS